MSSLIYAAKHDVLASLGFPKEHWPQLTSTSPLERLNMKIKRRSRVIGILPNNPSIVRLIGTLLAEKTDEWQVTRRHMSRESLARVFNPHNPQARLSDQWVA